jgi:hypothetical protein
MAEVAMSPTSPGFDDWLTPELNFLLLFNYQPVSFFSFFLCLGSIFYDGHHLSSPPSM